MTFFSLSDVKKNPLSFKQLLLFSAALSGCLLNIFFIHDGNSQAYFYLPAVPFLLIFSFVRINSSERNLRQKKILIPLSLLLLLGLGNFAYFMIRDGSDGLVHYIKVTFLERKMEKNAKTVSKSEIEGLRWLRDKSEKNAIIVTNKILSGTGDSRSFVVSSFCERPVYIEGDDYGAVPATVSKAERKKSVSDFFDGNRSAVEKLKNEGVDYAAIFKVFRYRPELLLSGKIVFENEEILILQLNN